MTKKNTTAKIAAIIALIAIFSSIIGTGVLVIIETYFSGKNTNTTNTENLSNAELQEMVKNLTSSGNLQIKDGSGNILKTDSGNEMTLSGNTIKIETLSGTTN